MPKEFYNEFKLGILGGGQLGKMLIQAAANLNIKTHVLDPDHQAPCKDIATEFTLGKLTDFNTVYEFGKKLDLLTIEIENVNTEALEKLEQEGIQVFPQPAVLKIIKDKGLQKQFYLDNKIPTAGFYLTNNKTEIQSSPFQPFIQKLRIGGYDGKGVKKISTKEELAFAFEEPCVIEEIVSIEKEVSVIVARNSVGEIKHFPLVELVFNPEVHLVDFLISPADVSPSIEDEAYRIACLLTEKLGLVGLLAVELFITTDGRVLVNEVAPRPHNSGHQTIEGNVTSQYEQYLRAILNLPLGDSSIVFPSVMINLLGEKGFEGEAKYEGLMNLFAMNGVHLHLYGKYHTKPFRKMGHITIVNKDLEQAKKTAIEVKKRIKVLSK